MVPHVGQAADVPLSVSAVPTCIMQEPLVWSEILPPQSWCGQGAFHHSAVLVKASQGAPEMVELAWGRRGMAPPQYTFCFFRTPKV